MRRRPSILRSMRPFGTIATGACSRYERAIDHAGERDGGLGDFGEGSGSACLGPGLGRSRRLRLFWKPSILAHLERWRAAGIDYLSINAGYDVVPWTETLEAVSKYRHWIRTHADTLVQVETVDDILRAHSQGKLAAVTFDLEGMNALNGDIGMVDLYYRLGVRQMLFAYNRNNLAGGGCHDEDIGLTEFGRAVIAEMNRVGMLVDCSHCAYRTSMEAIEASEAPVIFSHANARELWDHERNIWDDQIKACAATGGVIGVTGVGRFMGPKGPVVEHLVEHIDHMVELRRPGACRWLRPGQRVACP